MEHSDRWDEIWSEKRRSSAGMLGSLLAKDIIYRTVGGILRREIPEPGGKRILEMGSGTGLVSLSLAKRGAEVFMLDLSPEAVRFSQAVFERAGTEQRAVRASIVDLPFKDNTFDVTWNAGVIEHFERADQVQILSEMLRVTRPEGKAVVIVPSSEAGVYCRAKGYADRQGIWQPGYEVPMATVRDLATSIPARVTHEYRTGFLAEWHFMKYYFGRWRSLRLAWAGLIEIASLILFPLNRLPGYLLVSVLEKKRRSADAIS
jgi:ubiquinone/menaquinone biosynthesis C-methylase UbiE